MSDTSNSLDTASRLLREREERERERQQYRYQAMEILNTDTPDDVAEAQALGQKYGVPREAVQPNLKAYRANERAMMSAQLRQASPKMMSWLDNMENHAVARDEINLLSSLERLSIQMATDPNGLQLSTVKNVARAGMAGIMGVKSTLDNFEEEQLQKAADYYGEYDAWSQRETQRKAEGEGGWVNRLGMKTADFGAISVPYFWDTDPMPQPSQRLIEEAFDYNRSGWRRFLGISAEGGFNKEQAIIAVKPLIQDKIDAAVKRSREADLAAREMMPSTGDFFADTLLAGVRTVTEMGPMIASAVATKGKTAPAIVMGGQVYYNQFSEGREMGLSTRDATNRALMQAAVESVSERISLGIIDDMLKSDKGPVRSFASAMLKEQAQEQVATLGGRLVDWNYLEQDKTIEEFIAETPRAMLETAIVTAVASGAMQGTFLMVDMLSKQTVNDTLAAQQSASDSAIGNMLDTASRMKLRERSPEKLKEAVDAIVKDGRAEKVIVDLDGLTQALTDAGMDPNEVLLSMGVDASAIDTAAIVQGEVEVAMGTLLSSPVLGTARETIQAHLRLPGDTLTPAQKAAWNSTAAEYVQRGADLVRTQMDKDVDLASKVRDVEAQIFEGLQTVGAPGISAPVNRANAKLAARMAASIALRTNRDVNAVWAEIGPLLRMGVTPSAAPGAGLRSTAPSDLTERRLRQDVLTLENERASLRAEAQSIEDSVGEPAVAYSPEQADRLGAIDTRLGEIDAGLQDTYTRYSELGYDPATALAEDISLVRFANKPIDQITAEDVAAYDRAMAGTPAPRSADVVSFAEALRRRQGETLGQPMPTPDNYAPVEEVASVDGSFAFARGQLFATNRDLKVAMQDRVQRAADENDADLSDEDYLVRMTERDARSALIGNANAVGWYDEKVRKAIAALTLLHPELETDAEARFAFTWALAVTSNGLKVDKNFELAEKVYRAWNKSANSNAARRMPTNVGIGTAKKAINKSLGLYNTLVKQHGVDVVFKFMTDRQTVKQVMAFTGENVSGENLTTEVFGAAALGPKIGNGFFMNLYGEFGQLTMDRWLMRTWGRWTATLVTDYSSQAQDSRKKLAGLLKMLSPADKRAFEKIIRRPIKLREIDEVGLAIQRASQNPDLRAEMNELGLFDDATEAAVTNILGPPAKGADRNAVGAEIRKRGNALAKYLDGQKEQPSGPPERAKIRAVFARALENMKKDYPSLTMADLQALLWYPEKRLYDTAKAKDGKDTEGYEDDEAPDYANAARNLVVSKGVAEAKVRDAYTRIDADVQAARRAGRVERESAGGGGGGETQGFASGPGQETLGQTVTRTERDLPLYSAVGMAIEALPNRRMTHARAQGRIENGRAQTRAEAGRIKQEVADIGLRELLAGQRLVTPAELADILRVHQAIFRQIDITTAAPVTAASQSRQALLDQLPSLLVGSLINLAGIGASTVTQDDAQGFRVASREIDGWFYEAIAGPNGDEISRYKWEGDAYVRERVGPLFTEEVRLSPYITGIEQAVLLDWQSNWADTLSIAKTRSYLRDLATNALNAYTYKLDPDYVARRIPRDDVVDAYEGYGPSSVDLNVARLDPGDYDLDDTARHGEMRIVAEVATPPLFADQLVARYERELEIITERLKMGVIVHNIPGEGGRPVQVNSIARAQELQRLIETARDGARERPDTQSHSGEPGEIINILWSERKDSSKRKTLFVRQLQSDEAQSRARDVKQGIAPVEVTGSIKVTGIDAETILVDMSAEGIDPAYYDYNDREGITVKAMPGGMWSKVESIANLYGATADVQLRATPSPLPLVDSTTLWTNAAIRSLAVKAAEEGYQALAIPTAATSQEIQGNAKAAQHYETNVLGALQRLAARYGVEVVSETIESENGTHTVYSLPFTPEMRKDIRETGLPLYSGARGQYTPGSNILALTERADPSTFMHEMAHWYLHQVQVLASMDDAWATGELAAITEWYEGIKTGEKMQAIRARYRVVEEDGQFRLMYKNMQRGLYITEEAANAAVDYVEMQEAFAESFEQYLLTGKAPIPSLQDIFRQFKNWLISIYKGLMPGERANLNPQIREVLDRMLAVDLEVDAASAEAFRDAEEMAQEMFRRGIITARQLGLVGDRLAKAKEDVKEELLTRAYEERMRKEETFWREERERIKGDLIRQFDKSPLGRAFNWLAYQQWKDDVPEDRKGAPPAETQDETPFDIPFEQTGYHGTPRKIVSPLRPSQGGLFGPGIYLTKQPDTARKAYAGEAGIVYAADYDETRLATYTQWKAARSQAASELGAGKEREADALAVERMTGEGFIGVEAGNTVTIWNSANITQQTETLYSDPPGHGPITPPIDLPPVRLNLALVRELYGEEAVRRLPAAIRRRSSIATNIDDMLVSAETVRNTLKGKGPQTLTQWIMRRKSTRRDGVKEDRKWGIKGADGELRAMGLERLINNKTGETIDYVREQAEEQGFIRAETGGARATEYGDLDATPNDLLDALDREARGEAVVRVQDFAELQERAGAEQWLDWFNERGVDIYERNEKKLRAAMAKLIGETDESLVSPEQAAEMFGFPTGEELLDALSRIGNKNDWLNGEADRAMAREYGDMMRDGTMQAEAMEGARLDIAGRQAEIEMEALARALGQQAASKYARELARERIDMETVYQIQRYEQHLASERRFGQRSLEAMKRGDLAGALKAKQAQLIAGQMYSEGKKRAQKIEKHRLDLNKYLDSEARRGKIAQDYLDRIDALLEGYELRSSKQSPGVQRRRLSAADYAKQMIADGRETELPAEVLLLAEAAQKERWRDLTSTEVDYLVATVQNMAHLGRTKQKLLDAQEQRRFDAIIDELAGTLEAAPTVKDRRQSFTPTPLETTATWLRKAHARLTRLEFEFLRLDGRENGPLFNKLWMPFAKAADAETSRMRDAAIELRRLYNLLTPAQRNALFQKRVATPELGARRGAGMTMMDIMVIGLNWGNPGNRQALIDGYNWDADQVEAMLNRLLTDQHWDFIEGMWSLIGSYREDAFALEKSITGVEPKAVEGVTFTLANGRVIEGKYYPLSYSGTEPSALSVKQQKLDEAQMLSDMGKSYSKPMTRTGHLISRVGSGGKPVKLSINVAHEHVAAVIHDIAYRKAVIDTHKIVNDTRFTEAYIAAAGKEQYDMLRPWLASIATERSEEPGGFATDIMRGARRNFSIMAMGFKIGTATQQLTGLLQSTTVIGPRYMAQGFAKAFTGGPASFWSAWDWVSQKSEFMRDRPMGFDRDVRQVTEATKAQTPLAASQRNAFVLIGIMDTAVSTSTWVGAYDRALDGNVKGIDRADEDAAIAYADSVVRRTQSSGRTQDLPQMMRGTELEKLLTVVYSYFSTLYNFTSSQVLQVRAGQINPVVFTANMSLLYIVIPLIAAFLAGRFPPDEEEGEEELFAMAGKELASNAVGTVPFVRDVMSAVINPQYGYQMSPAGSVIESAAVGLGGIARGEGFKTEFAARKSFEALGVLFGLPTAQLWITGDYVYDLAQGTEDPLADPVDGAREALLRSER